MLRIKDHFQAHQTWVRFILPVDGERILTISDDGTLKAWHVPEQAPLHDFIGHRDVVRSALLLDDKRVVSASFDGDLRVWDVDSGQSIAVWEGHQAPIRCVALMGDTLISGDESGMIFFWDATSGHMKTSFRAHNEWVNMLVPVGEAHFYSVAGDNTLRRWHIDTLQSDYVLSGHTHWVSWATKLDAQRMVSSSWDKSLRLWNFASGECLRVFEGHGAAVRFVTQVDDSRMASVSFDRTLRLWNLDSENAISILQMEKAPLCVRRFNADTLLVGDVKGRVWSITYS